MLTKQEEKLMELDIRKADLNQAEAVMGFYYDLIDSMRNFEFRPLWEKDVYPTRQFIYNSIKNNELFIATNDRVIMGSMIMNHICADEYSKAPWKVSAKNDETMIIHALAVLPICQGAGIGMKMVDYAIKHCKDSNMKAIRLDVLLPNKPAHKLYAKMGFAYIGKIQLFYEDTGLADFLLYELGL